MKNNSDILASIPLFKELDTLHLDKVAVSAYQVALTKGNILFNQGDPADGFYIVIEGRIKLSFISRDGKEYIAEIFGPRQSFGEAVLFLGKPFPVCAQALVDTQVLYVPKNTVFECVENCAGFARKIIAGLCARLADRVQALEFLTVYSSVQRVIGYLLREVEMVEPEHDEVDIVLTVNKATLAAQLNLTPETLSRSLHKLTDDGLISVEGTTIHVHHIQQLRSYEGK